MSIRSAAARAKAIELEKLAGADRGMARGLALICKRGQFRVANLLGRTSATLASDKIHFARPPPSQFIRMARHFRPAHGAK